MKRSTLGARGQRSRSHKVEVRVGSLAETSLSTTLRRVALLNYDCMRCILVSRRMIY